MIEAAETAALSHGLGGVRPLESSQESRAWLRRLIRVDDWIAKFDGALIVFSVFGSATFSALGFLNRNLGIAGSPWLDILPRYLTLFIGLLGAAIATRRGSHIALDLASKLLPEVAARWTGFVADTLAAIVSGILALSAWDFIVVEQEGGAEILNVLPSWGPAVVLLWGFGIASFRFLLRASRSFWPILILGPVVLWAYGVFGQSSPEAAFWLGLLGMGLAVLTGAPLFVVLGGASLLFFWNEGSEIAVVSVEIYRLTEAPSLVTLPLFTLMGAVLARGHAPERLVGVARSCLGWAPGGLAVATVVVCAFFTTFTGASGVTILALGALLYRLLIQEGYSDKLSIGLITSSGSIGLLFAPALPLIIYGIVAKVDIDHMFLAGIGPGTLLIIVVAGAAVFMAKRSHLERHSFVWKDAKHALREGIWELLLPVLVLGLMLTGLATVVEAAAVGALYTVVIALFVKRDVDLKRELYEVSRDSGVLIGAVLVILGVALAFTYYLVDAEIPQEVVAFSRENISSRWMFLLSLNALLLVVGCLLDIFSAIIIFVPLLAPVAAAFEVHPVHLGIIFLANLEIGYLTPPVGMNLFLASFRFNRELPQIWKTALPFLLVLLVALMMITYIPALSLAFLPK